MLSTGTALFYSVIFGAAIFFCRFLPFIIFREKTKTGAFLDFVEKTAPAVAMTVLAFNALSSPVQEALTAQPPSLMGIIPVGAAALVTAILHLWKRNPLVSIFGGTILYMLLERLLVL